MNITTSLIQSKKLKELCAPQDTCIFHCQHGETGRETEMNNAQLQSVDGWYVVCAAYTLDELIDWLGDDFRELEKNGIKERPTWTAWGTETRIPIKGRSAHEYGVTSLEACFNLAVAIKEQK